MSLPSHRLPVYNSSISRTTIWRRKQTRMKKILSGVEVRAHSPTTDYMNVDWYGKDSTCENNIKNNCQEQSSAQHVSIDTFVPDEPIDRNCLIDWHSPTGKDTDRCNASKIDMGMHENSLSGDSSSQDAVSKDNSESFEELEILEHNDQQANQISGDASLNEDWHTKTINGMEDECCWFETESGDNDEWFHLPENEINEDCPLYAGAPITMMASMLLILNFAFCHSIAGQSLNDLLVLISLHCITPNKCLTSLYKFMKFFKHLKNPLTIHKFCNICSYPVRDADEKCSICATDLNKCSVSYFIEIPLALQISNLFSRPGFYEQLQHRFIKKKMHDNNIEDIYDGLLYKQHCMTNGKNNLSLMWYTDGVPLFNSSKFSIWPICFSINELPYTKRTRTENLLLGGLWFGECKPSMLTFWEPFAKSLKELKSCGLEVTCPSVPCPFMVNVILLCGTCDLPAKSIVLNMIQFNGKYGCPQCLQPGRSTKTKKGNVWTFPFDPTIIDGPKRTHTETIDHAKQAYEGNSRIYGINGPSWLSSVQPDIIHGTAIDCMHTVFLSVVRRLLNLWFSASFSKEFFSISKFVNKVDHRLLAIKPPNIITRVPRSIAKHMKFWKASECRSWLYYYSLPVLNGIMKEEFLEHYMLLVESTYILNMQSISLDQVNHCERLLVQFVCMFSALYGERHMTANVHQLLHLANVVRNLGPLWVYSCFPLEDFNGRLLKLFHGTQYPELQIVNAAGILAKLPELNYSYLDDADIGEFLTKMSRPKKSSHPLKLLGFVAITSLTSEQHHIFQQAFPVSPRHYSIYSRLQKECLNATSVICKSVEKRNSYTVECEIEGQIFLAQIYMYVKKYTCDCDCHSSINTVDCPSENLAVLLKLQKICDFLPVNTYGSTCNHLLHMKPSDIVTILPVHYIKQICVCVEVETKLFVAKSPNTYDFD